MTVAVPWDILQTSSKLAAGSHRDGHECGLRNALGTMLVWNADQSWGGRNTRKRRDGAMGKRWSWVAWSMLAVFAVGLAFTAVLGVLNGSDAGNRAILLYLPAFTAFMVVGALVVARRPANSIGWLFSTIALLTLGASLAGEYVQYAYVTRRDDLPFAVLAAWYLAWAAFPVFGLTFTFTLLLFPTGRLPSARWRPIAWLAAVEIIVSSVLAALQPTLPLEDQERTIPNPIGIRGLPAPEQGAVGAVLLGMFAVASAAACGSESSDCTSTSTPPTATRTPSWSGCSLSAPGPPTSARPAPRVGTSWPTQKATNSASCALGSSPSDHLRPGAKPLGRSSEAGGPGPRRSFVMRSMSESLLTTLRP